MNADARIGHTHVVAPDAVIVGASSTDDQLLAAFDRAVADGMVVRVHSVCAHGLAVAELLHIARLALAYCAVEARWELRSSQAADLHLIVPEPAAGTPSSAAEDRATTASPGERTATPNPGEAVRPSRLLERRPFRRQSPVFGGVA